MKLAYAGFRFIEAYQLYYIAMDTRIILREKIKNYVITAFWKIENFS